MNQLEFIEEYCKNSGLTPDKLNELGLFAIPCDCGGDSCKEWAMITRGSVTAHVDLCLTKEQ